MISKRTHNQLKDVLMDPEAPGVDEAYYVIHASGQNITVINPGRNGVEFNKTYGHFHNYQGVEVYNCLFGNGVLVMQRNDEEGEAKEFKVVTLRPGKQVEVPAGFGHTLINTGKNILVVADNTPREDGVINYNPIKSKKGLAYYVVEKKGEIGFETNPAYKAHPYISSE